MSRSFEKDALKRIHDCLDSVGLKRSKEELVVVGGAAMAAYGIKDLNSTDLDIAVTDDLMSDLGHDNRWQKMRDNQHMGMIANGVRVERLKRAPGTYAGYITVTDLMTVTAITPPLYDSTYNASTYQLIGERITPRGYRWHYGFSPLERILDWKLTLAGNPVYEGENGKHFKDARLISRFLLDQCK